MSHLLPSLHLPERRRVNWLRVTSHQRGPGLIHTLQLLLREKYHQRSERLLWEKDSYIVPSCCFSVFVFSQPLSSPPAIALHSGAPEGQTLVLKAWGIEGEQMVKGKV